MAPEIQFLIEKQQKRKLGKLDLKALEVWDRKKSDIETKSITRSSLSDDFIASPYQFYIDTRKFTPHKYMRDKSKGHHARSIGSIANHVTTPFILRENK